MEEKFIKDVDIMKALSYCNYVDYSVSLRDNKYNNIDYIAYKKLLDRVGFDDIKRCERLLHNRYVRKSRIYKMIDWMLQNGKVCYFCTFTLDENHVNCDLKYLRKVLTQSLISLETWYVGNVDYGDTTNRLHFHCIVMENEIHINKQSLVWPFGFYDIKVINITDYVAERLGSYIFKLTNHATKETTKNRIITPRGDYSFTKIIKN